MKIEVSNIQWDKPKGYSLKQCGLPSKKEKIIIECDDNEDLEDTFISDTLTDHFGWCVISSQYQIIES